MRVLIFTCLLIALANAQKFEHRRSLATSSLDQCREDLKKEEEDSEKWHRIANRRQKDLDNMIMAYKNLKDTVEQSARHYAQIANDHNLQNLLQVPNQAVAKATGELSNQQLDEAVSQRMEAEEHVRASQSNENTNFMMNIVYLLLATNLISAGIAVKFYFATKPSQEFHALLSD